MVVAKGKEGAAKTTAAASKKRPQRNEKGWQAEKSAMTRSAILEATIQCLLELGYANTTTALIANYAGVSRGAMMHHFPSRISVMRAVIDYLHVLRLQEYRDLMVDIDDPQSSLTDKAIRESVEAAWRYVNLPSFLAYQEMLAASRTDGELRQIIEPVEKDFEKQFLDTVKAVFPHWQNLARLEGAHDMVQFLMKGMALSHMSVRKNARAKRVMTYLTAILHDIYKEADLMEK
ncbi:putative transcriptional regulator [gamma proteobacterium HTCC2207]|jgi:AcrR family transcriptional regulator|uniref:Putative transcriptional regulator n=1 Tax=gamma proteobacterium HTCC2207 TaxID=314287 RepID=Q1YP88_9GAMM|nr:putative transcriptional regulator [gamma proteobacterium HTCC2207]MBT5104675.1 TetR/AcrR family transcriptional regulator [Porticoccaceae bacterium]MBT6114924.1 TetR/AcrR family transcriptional regulator [Porticoccaceae bacterium]MBT6593437.1 TetR/AcrR family transcriptional regulator [Porticoccaceae bacterium]MDB4426701.1 TetR/AcrR family transcriptional regulator [Porticoccaceae bacterium]